MSVQAPPVGNLKERIAALQQRSVSAPQQGQPPSQQSTSPSKPSSPPNGGASSLRSKIAKFESKGGVPIPRGSFGLGAPPESGRDTSRELYGNRIPGVNRPSGPVSRSSSPLPGVDESPGASGVRKRRLSVGAVESPTPTPAPLDLNAVMQKLAYQRNLDILNGTPTDASSSPGTDRAQSASDATSNSNSPISARRKSMQALAAGRRSVSSIDVFSKYGTQQESIDMKQTAPSIVISTEPSSTSPSIIEGSQIVDEPSELASSSPNRSKPPSPSSPNVPSPTTSPIARKTSVSPVTSPVSPASTNGPSQNAGIFGHEHPPDSPYLEFAKPSSPPASPQAKVQAPVPRKVTSPTRSKTKTDVPNIARPTRSSSLAPGPRPSRSPSPTPSMIHRPEVPETVAAPASTKSRGTSNDKPPQPRRVVAGLPANPPPVPDNEESNISYGSVTLGSHSETNLLDAVQKNKSGFSAVVHRKVTENPRSLPLSDARSVRSVPNMTSHARRAVGSSVSVSPGSPGYGDLAALLAEAALLEERLNRGDSASDISTEMDKLRDSDGFHLEPLSVPAIETYDDEVHDQVPPPPPPKGFPRMLSGFRKLASSVRSPTGSHSRLSTSGSEQSSEDSASLGTPSDNGIPFPGSHSNGSLDRPSSSGSSALGFGYPSASTKKNGGSMSRASSLADKLWHRSRTKSNNSNADRGKSPSPRKNVSPPNSAARSKVSRSNTQPPTLPPILAPGDNDPSSHRPISWQSLSSSTSTNTSSTVSPGGKLFTEELFDAFPSVPKELPQIPFPTGPEAGTTTFPRTSYDVGRSASPPFRTRYSAEKLG